MGTIISTIDIISSLLIVIAFFILGHYWKYTLRTDIKFFFAGILLSTLLFNLFNALEWLGAGYTFDNYGDLLGILAPMLWGIFFYTFLQHTAEIHLRESEEFNRALFDYNPIETVVVDTKGVIINFNSAKKKAGDRTPNIGDIMYKDYAARHDIDMYSELINCISSGKPKTFPEQKYLDKFLDITISPFPKGAIIISKDITERKLAEERAKKLGSAVEQLNDGLAIANLEGKLTYVNDAFAKMHGYSPDEVLGWDIKTLHYFKNKDKTQLAIFCNVFLVLWLSCYSYSFN